MHHRHYRTPLWVSVVAALAMLVATTLLFGGVTHAAADEAQSSSGIEVASTAAAGSNCHSRPISAEEITDQYIRTTDGSHEFTAYEAVEFGFVLSLQDGHCAGDSITFTVPKELGTDGNFSPVKMVAKDGVIVAYARYSSDRTVTVTLTDAVEDSSKHNFQASAWWKVHMEDTLVPGETRELEWNIGGEVRRTPIKVGVCPNCDRLGEGPSKWGTVSSLKPWYLTVTIVTPTASHDSQEFVITDQATSSGQNFACPDPTVGKAGIYSSAGPWGQPQYSRFVDVEIENCTNEKVVFKIVLNKGEKARIDVLVNVNPEDPGPWTDEVTVVSQEKTWVVDAKVVRKESGGNADYDPRPTPTPTPSPTPSTTPTPAPTPSPTPTPSATPTSVPSPTAAPTPTPTPTPSATPSVSPSPSPSASPAPTPEPTPTPKPTTPAPTPSPTPTPSVSPSPSPSAAKSSTSLVPLPEPSPQPSSADNPEKLAKTGTEGGAIALAIVFLTVGGLVLRARRRQAAHSER